MYDAHANALTNSYSGSILSLNLFHSFFLQTLSLPNYFKFKQAWREEKKKKQIQKWTHLSH